MAEIYRSVAVTGTRKLETERLLRVKGAERRQGQAAAGDGYPGAQGKPAPDTQQALPAAAKPQQQDAAAESASAAGQALVRERDLLLAEQRRLEQLEARNAELEETLLALEAELQSAHAALEADSASHREQARREGLAELQQEADAFRARLEADYVQARELFSSGLQAQNAKLQQHAVELAFAVVARLVGERYADANFSRAVIEEALDEVQGAGRIAVHVSQRDYELLQQIDESLLEAGRLSELELAADPRVSVGGCLIETENGIWDARLETQLQRLQDAIEQAMKVSS